MGRFIDLTGKKYGWLHVLNRDGVKNNKPSWRCVCKCGTETIVRGGDLKSGKTQSCGCLAKPNLCGLCFGKLTVVEELENRKWKCDCECGNTKIATTTGLLSGSTSNCGCFGKGSPIDLVGHRSGKLLVVKFHKHEKKNGGQSKRVYECLCDCGNTVFVKAAQLIESSKNNTKSCGCSNPAKPLDLVGKNFGLLKVVKRIESVDGNRVYECLCDCGNTKNVNSRLLVTGRTTSCGCYKKQKTRERFTTHGLTSSPEYSVWVSMHSRCNDTDDALYGGRGITVSERWSGKKGFQSFLNDMGERPSKTHSLDRLNVDKCYCKSNCVWSTPEEQANNKRSNRIIEYNGKKYTLANLCKLVDKHYGTMLYRINKQNLSVLEAIETTDKEYSKEERRSKFQNFTSSFNSKARKRGFNRIGDNLTAEEAWSVLEDQEHKCVYFDHCGHSKETGHNLTLDHKVPKSKGGYHTKSNIQWLCRSCNSSKASNEHPKFKEIKQ